MLARRDAASDLAYDIAVPTTGRASLERLLAGLDASPGLPPRALILVDDRREPDLDALAAAVPDGLSARVELLATNGRGPAAARNAGWRAARADWVAFLDDDVIPPPDWRERLQSDLRALGPAVAGSQGRVRVPLPRARRPTDWERNVAALEGARWATADMAFRRSALRAVGGFDERFPRAYREDADLALRLRAAGFELAVGAREVLHPVAPADRWVSVRKQAGNADDALMAALQGRGWRERAEAPPGRLALHMATTALGAGALGALALRRRRAAAVLGGGWLGATAQFALARILPGPRTSAEIATMLATSALIPPFASFHRLAGSARAASTSEPMSPTTAQRSGSTPSRAAASSTSPGAGLRQPQPSSGPCGHTHHGPSGPSSSSTRRFTAATSSSVTRPRAIPLWFETTARRTPAARRRSSAGRAPGIACTRAGSPL